MGRQGRGKNTGRDNQLWEKGREKPAAVAASFTVCLDTR